MSDQDVSMFTQCLKGSSSAPVGKRVIHPDQVLQELNDVPNYQRNEEMKNTFLGDNTDVNISDSLITSVCGDGTFVQNMIDRREIYRDAENALGGPFNVFEDTFPKFTVAPGDEIELNKTPVHNVGSQGRTGEGCSTPKDMVDHTFGPLRHLDLSVVADITSHPNLPQVLTECTKTNKRANSENSVPIKRSSENFALPKSSEATFVVPKPIRRNSKHTETGTFRKNDPSTSDADPIMQINKEADSNLASDLGEMKKTNSKNFVDPVSLEPKKPAACQNLDVAKEADLGETFVLDSGDTFVVSEKLPNQALKIGSADREMREQSQNETFESTREANLSKTRSKRISHVDADRGVENSKHDEMSCAPMPEDCEETMTDPYSSSSAMADCIDDSTSHNGASLSDTPRRAPDAKRLLTESCFTVNTPPSVHRLNFGDDDNDEKEKTDNRGATDAGTETSINDELSTLSVSDEEDGIVTIGKVIKRPKVEIILKPRELIKPTVDNDSAGLRRSTRNRMKPVRDWLGEKPVYAFSPSGNRRLLGSTSVVIHDPTLLKARSLSINVITDQQIRENAKKRNMRERRKAEALLRKARRIRELRALHKKGKNLNVTIESIVTSGSEDDSD